MYCWSLYAAYHVARGADAASDDEHHWEDEENEDLHKEYVDELTDDTLKYSHYNTSGFGTLLSM